MKTKIDYATQNEEWIRQYNKSQEEDPSSDEEIGTEDDDGRRFALAMSTRLGRLASLQCALLDDTTAGEDSTADNTPSIEHLLNHTQRQMDLDAASPRQLQLLERLLPQPTTASVTKTATILADEQDLGSTNDVDVDVDAFFEEYPECMKSDWDKIIISSDESDSGDDGSCEEEERRPSKDNRPRRAAPPASDKPSISRKNHHLHQSRSAPSSSSSGYEERPISSHGRQQPNTSNPQTKNLEGNPYQNRQRPPTTNDRVSDSSLPQNPYQTGPPSSNSFRYTPATQPTYEESSSSSHPTQSVAASASASWDNHNIVRNNHSNSHNSNNNNNPRGGGGSQTHLQRPPSSAPNPYVSNNRSSWEEHQNQQNPFQTARELAQIEEPPNSRSNATTSTRENHHDNGNWNNRHAQPPSHDPQQQQQQPNNPYSSIPDSLKRKFQPPKKGESTTVAKSANSSSNGGSRGGVQVRPPRPSSASGKKSETDDEEELPEELKHLDKELVKKIQNEIMESGDTITFDDIAGLEDAKQTVQEVVCWPMKRPDLFTGLRRAPNGLLLYGPPGTGKTLIGKAIAHESGATFFSISSSSLTSKWIGEGEKLVRTLFAVAAYREPAVVFIDEIDSLLTQRKASENEASRRIKTEFLVQLDGTGTTGQGRVLVIGATNRPQELDEAARRRFTKRLYIPLPVESDRRVLLHALLKTNNHMLVDADVDKLAKATEGFSGADLKSLCTDAAMGPIRQLGPRALEVAIKDVPPISFRHFKRSLKGTKPSVAPADLVQYEEWDQVYGSKRASEDDDEDDSDDE